MSLIRRQNAGPNSIVVWPGTRSIEWRADVSARLREPMIPTIRMFGPDTIAARLTLSRPLGENGGGLHIALLDIAATDGRFSDQLNHMTLRSATKTLLVLALALPVVQCVLDLGSRPAHEHGRRGRRRDHRPRRHRLPGRLVDQPGRPGHRAGAGRLERTPAETNDELTATDWSLHDQLTHDPAPPMSHDIYENPLITRYASREMATLWGDQRKFSTWRRLWVALAEAEAELGLPITKEQIAELRAHVDDIDFDAAEQLRAQAAARRDGPRPRLRRRVPDGPADHPSRRHELLRHRQHRSDPDPRIAADGRRAGWRR